MSTGKFSKSRMVVAGILVLMVSLMALPSKSMAEVLTISPFKIVLNAQGQYDDVQAVIRMPMESGYSLADYEVTLKFDNTPISEAFDFRYCYIDDNFLASFDRISLQANPDVIALANTIVIATVEGWYSAVNGDGESYTRSFSYTDTVEILDPDKSVKGEHVEAMK